MDQKARTALGVACVLFGLAIPMWFIGSIEWAPGPRGDVQLALLAVAYLAACAATLLALYCLRRWLKTHPD